MKMESGKYLYEHVIETINKWNVKKNCGIVVGATHPQMFENIRKMTPDMPYLIPGIGAQGGLGDAVSNLNEEQFQVYDKVTTQIKAQHDAAVKEAEASRKEYTQNAVNGANAVNSQEAKESTKEEQVETEEVKKEKQVETEEELLAKMKNKEWPNKETDEWFFKKLVGMDSDTVNAEAGKNDPTNTLPF